MMVGARYYTQIIAAALSVSRNEGDVRHGSKFTVSGTVPGCPLFPKPVIERYRPKRLIVAISGHGVIRA